jgi:two-component system, response regulator / RNA-binding antiterminator
MIWLSGGNDMRVLVIADSNDRIDPAVEALRQAGVESVQEMEGALGLLRRVADFQPDIILIDTASPSRDVLESLCVVNTYAPRPMVMFTSDDSDDSIAAAIAAGVTIYSVEGIDATRLEPVMRIATARFRQEQKISGKWSDATLKQRERQSVDTAKGLLMARDGLNEENAYRVLREAAMKSRRSLVEVATDLLRRWQA